MKPFIRIISAVALTAVACLTGRDVSAAPFIPGNIVVLQEGNGSATLSTTSSPVFLLEYLPSTAGQAIPVQTISIPATGANRLTQSSGSSSEGFITRSVNSNAVVFVGYDANVGSNNVPGTAGTLVNRVVGQVDLNGNYTRTAVSSTAYSGSNIRSSTSDGINYWTAGTASPTTEEGIWYSAAGAAPIQITTTAVNARVTRIYNGNLYYSTAGAISGFTGLPATPTAAVATGITSSSIYDFAINPAGNVAYVCDDSGNGGSVGGIQKWTFNGSTWAKQFTFGSSVNTASNNLTAGCRGLAVDFSGTHPVIYATTADTTTKVITITDNSAFTDTSDSADQAVILAVANNNTAFRGVALAPPSTSLATAPSITGITPTAATNAVGSSVTFTLTGGAGYPLASNFWYEITGSTTKTTNLVATTTTGALTLANLQLANTAKFFAVLSNASGSVTSSVASLTVIPGNPNITGLVLTNSTVNAGQTVIFTLTGSFGIPTGSNFWYEITGLTTNLISGATGTTLSLTNVLGANSGSYFAIVSNTFGSSTSSVVSLTVIDPIIQVQPSSSQGVVNGTIHFTVTAAGTAPSYQWYFSDTNGDLLAPASSLGDASVISGANTSTLTVANLQPADLTNFMVVVSNGYGSVTSSVASILSGTNNPGMVPYTRGMLALWDFDGQQFTNLAVNPNSLNNPAPFIGSGTAFAVGTCFDPGTSPFSGSVDANDVGFDAGLGGYVEIPFGFEQPSPNFSWGTSNYPLNATTGTNKQNGVQFNVSTVGARNITVSYDSRVSATASDYERLQYTTNGTTWIDYPASSTFAGISSTYVTYQYSLIGFPGVDNNPNFGVRVVTEFQDTATYGIGTLNDWIGTANTYGTAGTVTYDLVAIQGDAITNNNTPPILSPFVNTNMVDTNTLVLSFSANDLDMPASKLTFSVVSLDTLTATFFNRTVNPTFSVSNPSSTNFLLSISFAGSFIPDPIDAAPILITATDTNGESTTASFILTVQSINQPPTNTLTLLPATNTLANTALTIPFTVGSTRDPVTNLTWVVTSDNNTVIPAGNVVVGGNTNTGNLTLTITPAANQVGNALLSVTVFDNDPQEPRSTTANIAVVVRPNTNAVAVDYFNYDNSGSLDTVATNYWLHLSGINGQLKVGGGVATVDTSDNTENLQVQLTGSPYKTNSGAVLYSSFTVNMSSAQMPTVNGSYFTAFNDGSGNTADVEDCLVAATNGAAPGFYRLGIANVVGATALNAQMFPQDLTPGQTYVVITSLVLANGFSTLWVSPTNQSSASVTDTTAPATATNLYSISNFELRESGTVAGSINVGSLTVGLTFNSVFYPAQANPDTYAVAENSTNLLSPLPNDAGWSLNITALTPDGNETATAVGGTNVSFIPAPNFVGTATVGYTIQDNLGNTSSSTITVLVTNIPPAANPDSYNVPENSVNNVLSPLANDVLETSGGSLSLVPGSLTPTNGTATISGTNVLFTPTTGFTGTATIGYSVTDGIGGTNSSVITVAVGSVAAIPVSAQISGGKLVLSWNNAVFSLQTSTNVAGPYITIPGASSPYTNLISTNAAGFFRLVH